MHFRLSLAALCAALCLCGSCTRPAEPVYLGITDAAAVQLPSLTFGSEGGVCSVRVQATGSWYLSAPEWLKADPRVVEVAYLADQMDDVNRNIQRISIIMLVLSVLLLIVSYTLISNSVLLGIYSRRFTIHTMKLVGARWSLIRRPFLRHSIITGLVASLLACAVLAAIVYTLYHYQPGAEALIGQKEMIITGATVFALGFIIVMLCTLLSVNRFLRMTAGELYTV